MEVLLDRFKFFDNKIKDILNEVAAEEKIYNVRSQMNTISWIMHLWSKACQDQYQRALRDTKEYTQKILRGGCYILNFGTLEQMNLLMVNLYNFWCKEKIDAMVSTENVSGHKKH